MMTPEVYALSIVGSYGIGVAVTLYFARRVRRQPPVAETDLPTDLLTHPARERLNRILARGGFSGDADIRQGFALPVQKANTHEPLALAFWNAASIASTLKNRAADSLYIRSTDGTYRLIDLDVDHLIDAARALQGGSK